MEVLHLYIITMKPSSTVGDRLQFIKKLPYGCAVKETQTLYIQYIQ